MKFMDLFPTTIAVSKLETLTTDVIERAITLVRNERLYDMGIHGSYTVEQQILEHPIFEGVKAEIIGLCKEFSRGYCHVIEDIGICNSWANAVEAGQSIPAHKHNNSYISGSFYLTHGSSFSITSPVFLNLFGLMPRIEGSNFRTWDSYSLTPEPGMVVLFPSGLYHGVTTSGSSETRYSVAFNAIPVGPIGIPTALLEIRPR